MLDVVLLDRLRCLFDVVKFYFLNVRLKRIMMTHVSSLFYLLIVVAVRVYRSWDAHSSLVDIPSFWRCRHPLIIKSVLQLLVFLRVQITFST